MTEPQQLNEILRVTVGSGLHGMAIEGTDDHDEMGIFIEPIERVVGLDAPLGSAVWRTQPEGHRSGPGDIDLVRYSLRHYMRLATQGNPTVLLPLFAPAEAYHILTTDGMALIELADAIVSKRAGPRFLGYMGHQIERLEGKRKSKPNRPELIEAHGYDTKFASHAVRLALQGVELMQTGRLTLPMPDGQLKVVRDIKTGQWELENVLMLVRSLEAELVDAIRRSKLREAPAVNRLNSWMASVHLDHWTRVR
jgi:predicted nucleotidyltransferase